MLRLLLYLKVIFLLLSIGVIVADQASQPWLVDGVDIVRQAGRVIVEKAGQAAAWAMSAG